MEPSSPIILGGRGGSQRSARRTCHGGSLPGGGGRFAFLRSCFIKPIILSSWKQDSTRILSLPPEKEKLLLWGGRSARQFLLPENGDAGKGRLIFLVFLTGRAEPLLIEPGVEPLAGFALLLCLLRFDLVHIYISHNLVALETRFDKNLVWGYSPTSEPGDLAEEGDFLR